MQLLSSVFTWQLEVSGTNRSMQICLLCSIQNGSYICRLCIAVLHSAGMYTNIVCGPVSSVACVIVLLPVMTLNLQLLLDACSIIN